MEKFGSKVRSIIGWAKHHKVDDDGVQDDELKVRAAALEAKAHVEQMINASPEQFVDKKFVLSPTQGRVRFHHPDQPLEVLMAGHEVLQGEILAYLEAGPLIIPLVNPIYGIISAVFVEEGENVAAECPLIAISPRVL